VEEVTIGIALASSLSLCFFEKPFCAPHLIIRTEHFVGTEIRLSIAVQSIMQKCGNPFLYIVKDIIRFYNEINDVQ